MIWPTNLPLGYFEYPLSAAERVGCEALWSDWSPAGGTRRVVPDGRCEIILGFECDGVGPIGQLSPLISGPSTSWRAVELRPGYCFIGARLRPGYVPMVLMSDASLTVNRAFRGGAAVDLVPELEDLCSPQGTCSSLARRMLDIITARFAKASALVFPRLRASIDALDENCGCLDVASIATLHSVDSRTIRRDFRASIGLGPKDYAKIVQFQTALRLMRRERMDTAEVAAEAGYTDQSHMTRRFRQLGGFTPAQSVVVPLLGAPL